MTSDPEYRSSGLAKVFLRPLGQQQAQPLSRRGRRRQQSHQNESAYESRDSSNQEVIRWPPSIDADWISEKPA